MFLSEDEGIQSFTIKYDVRWTFFINALIYQVPFYFHFAGRFYKENTQRFFKKKRESEGGGGHFSKGVTKLMIYYRLWETYQKTDRI